MAKTTETITFEWSRNFGDCYDCGMPAAYRAVDAYGPGKHRLLCSICAAESAAEGQPIARLDRNPHEDDQPDAMNQGVHVALGTFHGGIACECGHIVNEDLWEAHCESEGE